MFSALICNAAAGMRNSYICTDKLYFATSDLVCVTFSEQEACCSLDKADEAGTPVGLPEATTSKGICLNVVSHLILTLSLQPWMETYNTRTYYVL